MSQTPETFFEGPQLELAQLVDQADAEAVFKKAQSMSLEQLNAFGKENMTVLFYAMEKPPSEQKWYPVMSALIKAGADPIQTAGPRNLSFMKVAMGEAYVHRLGTLKAALDAGVNPDTSVYEDGEAPLITDVADQGGLDAIRLLVEHGADVNRRDAGGSTAILDAIATLGLDEVNYLLDHGADPRIADYYGVSFPYMLSEKINNLKDLKDSRLPAALAIRDRIVKMGVVWPPENPEQLRARSKADYKKKTGKDLIYMPDEGYQAFVPKYVPAPVRKVPVLR
ncbi:MAG: ankyrin repeat domain-containing protein [Limnohabitans sp.]